MMPELISILIISNVVVDYHVKQSAKFGKERKVNKKYWLIACVPHYTKFKEKPCRRNLFCFLYFTVLYIASSIVEENEEWIGMLTLEWRVPRSRWRRQSWRALSWPAL